MCAILQRNTNLQTSVCDRKWHNFIVSIFHTSSTHATAIDSWLVMDSRNKSAVICIAQYSITLGYCCSRRDISIRLECVLVVIQPIFRCIHYRTVSNRYILIALMPNNSIYVYLGVILTFSKRKRVLM